MLYERRKEGKQPEYATLSIYKPDRVEVAYAGKDAGGIERYDNFEEAKNMLTEKGFQPAF